MPKKIRIEFKVKEMDVWTLPGHTGICLSFCDLFIFLLPEEDV